MGAVFGKRLEERVEFVLLLPFYGDYAISGVAADV
jgi:hypothetical protein